ncbi:hypothetical protein D1007_34604 [Hordeum vulgare]|nr:hypothetical protein D1007_34604 [Hordeum vulgare]
MAGSGFEPFTSTSVGHEAPRRRWPSGLLSATPGRRPPFDSNLTCNMGKPLSRHNWCLDPASGLTEGVAVRLAAERCGGRATPPLVRRRRPWVSSDANMVRRARQQTWEATEALAAVDVGEVESRSPTPHIMHGCGSRNRVVVDIVSS